MPKARPGEPGAIALTPLEFLDRLAALIPVPRAHRHHYHGVLAPNARLRAAVTAQAGLPAAPAPDSGTGLPLLPTEEDAPSQEEPPERERTRAALSAADQPSGWDPSQPEKVPEFNFDQSAW